MSELLDFVHEKVQELVEKAEETADEAEQYLDVANAVDNAKKASDPRDYVPLDDLPYGEERARLAGAPEGMRSVADQLRTLDVESTPLGQIANILEEAENDIEAVKSTIEDCTELPADTVDDEFSF